MLCSWCRFTNCASYCRGGRVSTWVQSMAPESVILLSKLYFQSPTTNAWHTHGPLQVEIVCNSPPCIFIGWVAHQFGEEVCVNHMHNVVDCLPHRRATHALHVGNRVVMATITKEPANSVKLLNQRKCSHQRNIKLQPL